MTSKEMLDTPMRPTGEIQRSTFSFLREKDRIAEDTGTDKI